ncbi:hypothetical protein WJX82_000068 [Trebouxia sp. C0006]
MGREVPAPRSWAEDLNTYRTSRGSQAFGSLQGQEQPYRVPRTKLCPLGNTQHKAFTTGDRPYKGNKQDGSLERYERHGWGDVSLLKPNSTRPTIYDQPPKLRSALPSETKDGRHGLFGTLQGTEAGSPNLDSWMGHPLVNPTKGKLGLAAPTDAKGRKDLFTVLDMQHPARPSDDAWMGNMLVDPARGKAHAAGPEERMGRKDLFDLMQQKILLQAQKGGHSSRGQDGALTDAWIGNMLMDPKKGKQEVITPNNMDHLTSMKWDPYSKETLEWDNHIPRPQGKLIMHSGEVSGKRDTMQGILSGTAKPGVEGTHPHKADPESPAMYAIMASQPPAAQDLAGVVMHRKRVVRPVPGEGHTPVFQERYAWLGKPKDGSEKPKGPLAGVTHPVGAQSNSVWH